VIREDAASAAKTQGSFSGWWVSSTSHPGALARWLLYVGWVSPCCGSTRGVSNVLRWGRARGAPGRERDRARATCFSRVVARRGRHRELTGLIGFVGLIVPHAARRIAGPDLRLLLPVCCSAGRSSRRSDLVARASFAGSDPSRRSRRDRDARGPSRSSCCVVRRARGLVPVFRRHAPFDACIAGMGRSACQRALDWRDIEGGPCESTHITRSQRS